MNIWRLGETDYHDEFIKHGIITNRWLINKPKLTSNYLKSLVGDGVRCLTKWIKIAPNDIIFLCSKKYFYGVCISNGVYDYSRNHTFSDGHRIPVIPVSFLIPPRKQISHNFKIKTNSPDTFAYPNDYGFTLEGLQEIVKNISNDIYNKIYDESVDSGIFEFKSGYNPTKLKGVRLTKKRRTQLNLLHKNIQKKIYQQLDAIYPGNIGTENNSGYSTKIDLVRRLGNNYIFYEIKVYDNLKMCIREALGQLMEYSCWCGKECASELIIITQHELDKTAYNYLRYIRKQHKLKVNYQRFNLKTNKLENPEF